MTKAKPKRPRDRSNVAFHAVATDHGCRVRLCYGYLNLAEACSLHDWLTQAIEYLEAKEDE